MASGYEVFCRELLPRLTSQQPRLSQAERISKAVLLWRCMRADDQKRYEDNALKVTERSKLNEQDITQGCCRLLDTSSEECARDTLKDIESDIYDNMDCGFEKCQQSLEKDRIEIDETVPPHDPAGSQFSYDYDTASNIQVTKPEKSQLDTIATTKGRRSASMAATQKLRQFGRKKVSRHEDSQTCEQKETTNSKQKENPSSGNETIAARRGTRAASAAATQKLHKLVKTRWIQSRNPACTEANKINIERGNKRKATDDDTSFKKKSVQIKQKHSQPYSTNDCCSSSNNERRNIESNLYGDNSISTMKNEKVSNPPTLKLHELMRNWSDQLNDDTRLCKDDCGDDHLSGEAMHIDKQDFGSALDLADLKSCRENMKSVSSISEGITVALAIDEKCQGSVGTCCDGEIGRLDCESAFTHQDKIPEIENCRGEELEAPQQYVNTDEKTPNVSFQAGKDVDDEIISNDGDDVSYLSVDNVIIGQTNNVHDEILVSPDDKSSKRGIDVSEKLSGENKNTAEDKTQPQNTSSELSSHERDSILHYGDSNSGEENGSDMDNQSITSDWTNAVIAAATQKLMSIKKKRPIKVLSKVFDSDETPIQRNSKVDTDDVDIGGKPAGSKKQRAPGSTTTIKKKKVVDIVKKTWSIQFQNNDFDNQGDFDYGVDDNEDTDEDSSAYDDYDEKQHLGISDTVAKGSQDETIAKSKNSRAASVAAKKRLHIQASSSFKAGDLGHNKKKWARKKSDRTTIFHETSSKKSNTVPTTTSGMMMASAKWQSAAFSSGANDFSNEVVSDGAELKISKSRLGDREWQNALWGEERVQAVTKAIDCVYDMSLTGRNFKLFGNDMIQCFYDVATVTGEPIRSKALKYVEHLANRWKYTVMQAGWKVGERPKPSEVIEVVTGMYCMERVGVSHDLKEEVIAFMDGKEAFKAHEYFGWDPLGKQGLPSDGQGGREVITDAVVSRYRLYSSSLIHAFYADRVGLMLGCHFLEIFKWLPKLRPYRSPMDMLFEDYVDQCYLVTHVVFTANNWGELRLSPDLFPHEYWYLRHHLPVQIYLRDVHLISEFVECLRCFGETDDDPLIRQGMRSLLSSQSSDGVWDNADKFDTYRTYHATMCGAQALLAHKFRGFGPGIPAVLPLLEQWSGNDNDSGIGGKTCVTLAKDLQDRVTSLHRQVRKERFEMFKHIPICTSPQHYTPYFGRDNLVHHEESTRSDSVNDLDHPMQMTSYVDERLATFKHVIRKFAKRYAMSYQPPASVSEPPMVAYGNDISTSNEAISHDVISNHEVIASKNIATENIISNKEYEKLHTNHPLA